MLSIINLSRKLPTTVKTKPRIFRAEGRKLFSSKGNAADDLAKRESRFSRSSTMNSKTNRAIYGNSLVIITGAAFTIGGLLFATDYELKRNPNGTIATLYRGSILENFMLFIYNSTFKSFQEYLLPVSDKLIPDWATDAYYSASNIPVGTPAPPLLVLDLEKTIIGSEYSAKHGWRHVRRPGLEKFFEQLRQYYEIVIISDNETPGQSEIFEEIDKINACFKLGPAASELRDNVLLKRIDLMNRDERKIILIDDDPRSFQLCERNTLHIKPFEDINDQSDEVLLDLIPLLQALVQEGVEDFPLALDRLGTREAQEAAIEYQLRVARKKKAEEMQRHKGIGGALRDFMPPASLEDIVSSCSLTSDRVVGMEAKAPGLKPKSTTTDDSTAAAAAIVKKKGRLWQVQEDFEKEQEEHNQKMKEKMNEAYIKKLQAKAEEQEKKNRK